MKDNLVYVSQRVQRIWVLDRDESIAKILEIWRRDVVLPLNWVCDELHDLQGIDLKDLIIRF
jgi:hypothetical protein